MVGVKRHKNIISRVLAVLMGTPIMLACSKLISVAHGSMENARTINSRIIIVKTNNWYLRKFVQS